MRLVAFLLIGSLATVAVLTQERRPASLSSRIDAEVWGIVAVERAGPNVPTVPAIPTIK